jgi:hypothetical protein
MTSFLTGNKDIDTKILLNLTEVDLKNLALIDKFTNEILKSEYFWKMKFSQKYGIKDLKDELYLFEGYNWKKLWRKIDVEQKLILNGSIKFKKIILTRLLLSLKEKITFVDLLNTVELACLENNLKYIELLLSDYFDLVKDFFGEFFFNIKYQKLNDKILIKLINLFVKYDIHLCSLDLLKFISHGRKKLVKHFLTIESLKGELKEKSRGIFHEAAGYLEKTNDYDMIHILLSSYLNDNWGFK